jgi:hypothetical protein
MKSKPPPLYSVFFATVRTNSRDSHYALFEEEEGGIVSRSLYIVTVAKNIVTSSCMLLLESTVVTCFDYVNAPIASDEYNSDGHADVINVHRY